MIDDITTCDEHGHWDVWEIKLLCEYRDQLRGTLSLAEEGLANYEEENARLTAHAQAEYNRGFARGSGDEGAYQREIARLKRLLNPRLWTQEESEAWHRAIPDLYKAFEALRDDAPQPGEPPK